MTASIKYTCSTCGKQHEEWPALAYDSPANYYLLSDEDKNRIGQLDSDFCIIEHPGQTDLFIRGSLVQKVNDACQDLHYGLWVSLSEKSFDDYSDNFDNAQHETTYFGWLSNDLPGYDFSKGSIPTTVITKTGNSRPEIVPHQNFDHPFVFDYYNGISKEEAGRRIKEMLKIVVEEKTAGDPKKPWWKIW